MPPCANSVNHQGKNGKYLAWAFTAKGFKNPLVTPAGVSGVRARDLSAASGSGANFWYDGNLRASERTGGAKGHVREIQRRRIYAAFMLAKQVKQKGSHYLYPVVERNVPVIGKAIQIAIKKLLTEK